MNKQDEFNKELLENFKEAKECTESLTGLELNLIELVHLKNIVRDCMIENQKNQKLYDKFIIYFEARWRFLLYFYNYGPWDHRKMLRTYGDKEMRMGMVIKAADIAQPYIFRELQLRQELFNKL